ncbi:MAG: hypothetical protein SCALA702_17550 [Melioribacteraceae bacterium]|nr:MAG: hypothetical protein SCALA702_17550 [Melioribacteraceae bacterium]
MSRSRISGFYQLSVQNRLEALVERGVLNEEEMRSLINGKRVLKADEADKMIENVIGVFGLPMGLGLNFLVNRKEYLVPMVVEEPSILAAVSSAAKIARSAGGFESVADDSILIGQIQIVDVPNISRAKSLILQKKDEIIGLANSLHPNMVGRGGGAKDLEIYIHYGRGKHSDMLVVHLLVDTKDAMGANLVNSMCEGVAPLLEKITDGEVFLRILSNLADRALVRSKVTLPVQLLKMNGYSGEEVRDGIILASDFAAIDPYRATTHNKGIMNGIDPVAIATGNDWRAIESAAHAYAARGGRYTSLTKWYKNDAGDLVGQIEVPMKVGTVGGSLESNPVIKLAYKILDVQNARELAEVMGAVGLAQNFSAIRALATEGIQRGHMSLHARSVAMTAGTSEDIFEEVVEKLIESGEIKTWKAKEIIDEISDRKRVPSIPGKEKIADPYHAAGNGKVILFGEHAVVYGSHAVAAPIPLAIEASVKDADDGVNLFIPKWGVEKKVIKDDVHQYSVYRSLEMILDELDLRDRNMTLEVFPKLPRAMGLGGSAALAVAIIRALSQHYKLNLSDEHVNSLAFRSEQLVHGEPSGIDNTLATYGKFILFKKDDPPFMQDIEVKERIPVVIGLSGVASLTASTVGKVKKAWQANQRLYQRIFDEINAIALEGVEAVKSMDLVKLGELMNVNHGLLNALQVSSWELEELVEIARNHGALGAKLTGGGGGGAVIALAPDNPEKVSQALKDAGYNSLIAYIG